MEDTSQFPEELTKPYNPPLVEEGIIAKWEKADVFNPDNTKKDAQPFSMVLPPPNVTGVLHLGHSFETTIQDIVIRYQRMNGKKVLWLPGTDHAAIATQAKFEKDLTKKEKKSRHDFTREEFFGMVQAFALENQANILTQLKKMGLSLNWSRLAFTLDAPRELAVRTAFKNMYDAGLIYRGYRIVNWDPKGQTTVSDDEIEYEETEGALYTFKYSSDFPISIATTRPETKVGDVAVAVNPSDERYQQFVGKTYDIEFAGVPISIKVVADEAVDKEFGTGAIGVTPAHSFIDWEIAQRHNLPHPQVINEFAKMTVEGELKGKKVLEARAAVVEWLKAQNLLEKEEKIPQNIAKAERSGGTIEPLPKLQWFIDVNKKFTVKNSRNEAIPSDKEISLKELMKGVVEQKQIKVIPERAEKTYFHWIDNLRDWCISRQIIYGHRIPVWYKGEEIYVGLEAPAGEGWQQDADTLDTWFSSGLWTFSTLGWPNETDDLKTYHPTSVIMPGHEILFFWVARMILMTGFLLGDIPFKVAYLHGIVRDSQGRKFSKSLNNGIDPLEITSKHGTDALRMALIAGVAPGNDTTFDLQKVKAYQHFANKLWNITRFILTNNANQDFYQSETLPTADSEADKKVLEQLEAVTKETTKALEELRFHEAAEAIYQFTWHEFADMYLEESKNQLGEDATKEGTQKILAYCLIVILKLLHPFMPFITEHIWGMVKKDTVLAIEKWPA